MRVGLLCGSKSERGGVRRVWCAAGAAFCAFVGAGSVYLLVWLGVSASPSKAKRCGRSMFFDTTRHVAQTCLYLREEIRSCLLNPFPQNKVGVGK